MRVEPQAQPVRWKGQSRALDGYSINVATATHWRLTSECTHLDSEGPVLTDAAGATSPPPPSTSTLPSAFFDGRYLTTSRRSPLSSGTCAVSKDESLTRKEEIGGGSDS